MPYIDPGISPSGHFRGHSFIHSFFICTKQASKAQRHSTSDTVQRSPKTSKTNFTCDTKHAEAHAHHTHGKRKREGELFRLPHPPSPSRTCDHLRDFQNYQTTIPACTEILLLFAYFIQFCVILCVLMFLYYYVTVIDLCIENVRLSRF